MKVIGFANQYYTLWNLTTVPQYEMVNGQHIHVGTKYNYTYIQNLSFDLDEAIKKVSEKYGIENPEVDESLKGISTRSYERYESKPMPFEVFPFGKCKWMNIETSNDVYQLKRVYFESGGNGGKSEPKSTERRRKVLARRRLVELGELLKFTHEVKKYDQSTDSTITVIEKYTTPKNYEYLQKVKNSTHLHTEGEKVELNLIFHNCTHYDTVYGTVFIYTFKNEIGQEYIYKGSNPPAIYNDNEFYRVKATIKHNEYNGVKQTLIQRVKIIK